ncbi:dipicolinate synthase subunit A N-terminal domain-containing protein [Lawsonibacter celer]|uniref:dipicolinate synthase subunit A N-terminal domain-containing protein n=1 Tax=Lawsonibacter celer TaxID=2986526 RepID=UPI001FADA65D|nr:dipicolinate synthase subunit A N-terminal domain-containing protein [Lawsonibacter celer]
MRHRWNIWVLGGDLRQSKLAELLAGDGHAVHTLALEEAGALPGVRAESGLEGISQADCVVLPLPAVGEDLRLNTPLSTQSWPLERVLAALRPEQVLCGGRVSQAARDLAERRGLTILDYFAREELAVANAVPAALAKQTQCPAKEKTEQGGKKLRGGGFGMYNNKTDKVSGQENRRGTDGQQTDVPGAAGADGGLPGLGRSARRGRRPVPAGGAAVSRAGGLPKSLRKSLRWNSYYRRRGQSPVYQ